MKNNLKNVLVRYVRDNKKNGSLKGVIVGTKDGVGWSLCCKKDRFNKDLGLSIAIDRATVGTGVKVQIPAEISSHLMSMEDRRKRYFKL